MKSVVIVLVNYFREKLTKFCIESLNNTLSNQKIKLVVIDNNSEDNSSEMLREFYDKKIISDLVLNEENLGEIFALNQGWEIVKRKYGDCDFFLWMIQDFFCLKGWFENAMVTMLDLNLQYVSCLYLKGVSTGKYIHTPVQETKNGGKYGLLKFRRRYDWDIGHAPLVELNTIIDMKEFPAYIDNCSQMSFYHFLQIEKNLLGVRLYKPNILMQDPEYNNPKYIPYYRKKSGKNQIMEHMKTLRRNMKIGCVEDPEDYYSNSGYEVSEYYSKGIETIIPNELWWYNYERDGENIV